jgi:hypothetical protein
MSSERETSWQARVQELEQTINEMKRKLERYELIGTRILEFTEKDLIQRANTILNVSKLTDIAKQHCTDVCTLRLILFQSLTYFYADD